jgi:DNA replication and repair protein RecF
VYLTAFDSNAELTKENFHKMISSYIDKDTVKGYTTFGPHRDDINFLWNEKRLKEFGSDGVHKSFIIALKAAELDLIRDMKNEKAVLLMDDPFSDLDKNHKIALENIFPLADQCFISCLSHEKEFFTGRNSSFLEIRNGKVIEG